MTVDALRTSLNQHPDLPDLVCYTDHTNVVETAAILAGTKKTMQQLNKNNTTFVKAEVTVYVVGLQWNEIECLCAATPDKTFRQFSPCSPCIATPHRSLPST